MVFLRGSQVQGEDEVNCEILEAVFVKRALELRDNQTPKSAPPVRSPFGHAFVSVFEGNRYPSVAAIVAPPYPNYRNAFAKTNTYGSVRLLAREEIWKIVLL